MPQSHVKLKEAVRLHLNSPGILNIFWNIFLKFDEENKNEMSAILPSILVIWMIHVIICPMHTYKCIGTGSTCTFVMMVHCLLSQVYFRQVIHFIIIVDIDIYINDAPT